MLTVGLLVYIELRFSLVRFRAACQPRNARHMLMPSGSAGSSRQSWYSGDAKAGRFPTETPDTCPLPGLSIPSIYHLFDMDMTCQAGSWSRGDPESHHRVLQVLICP